MLEFDEVQLEYLDLLQKVVILLKDKTENSAERQRTLYHLRALCSVKLCSGDGEIGPTAFSTFDQKVRERQLSIFSMLSNLGTESLFDSERKVNENV